MKEIISVHLPASLNSNPQATTSLNSKEGKMTSAGISSELSVQPFRLLDLPLEVRNMIFHQLLVLPGPIAFNTFVIAPFLDKATSRSGTFLTSPYAYFPPGNYPYVLYDRSNGKCLIQQSNLFNIFLASKTIYRETVPIYFGRNSFRFANMDYWKLFHAKMGQEYRWQLASIDLTYSGRAPAQATKLLLDCMGLKELTLRLDYDSVGSCTSTAPYEPRLYGMNDLLRLRGLTMLKLILVEEKLRCYNRHCHHKGLVGSSGYQYWYEYTEEAITALKQRLEILKQPYDPRKLKRQENKDFNSKVTKAERTVFGEANVITRSERRMLDTKQNVPSA